VEPCQGMGIDPAKKPTAAQRRGRNALDCLLEAEGDGKEKSGEGKHP